jgi:hypothetical protein
MSIKLRKCLACVYVNLILVHFIATKCNSFKESHILLFYDVLGSIEVVITECKYELTISTNKMIVYIVHFKPKLNLRNQQERLPPCMYVFMYV